ncbi:MAG: peptidoglycan DD-metalloendopeptidase family protein [Thermomicrobiales bacterium]|nr:peptidoglycan DD-metalloendopeptidase family protein [Thermomicrobiales bacterium]
MRHPGGSRRPRRGALGAIVAATLLVAAVTPLPLVGTPQAGAASSGRIAHSEDGVVLRDEPLYGSGILGVLPDGAAVDLRTNAYDTVYDSDGETRWWPVASDLGDGWVAGFYLEIDGWDSANAAPPAAPEAAAGGTGGVQELLPAALTDALALVSEPDGVNLRSDPGTAAEAISTLVYNQVVDLRIDQADTIYVDGSRWWPVSAAGVDGWVSGDFLAPADAADLGDQIRADVAERVADAGVSNDAPGKSGPVFTPNQFAQVATDDGTGVNMRADGAPDAERIGAVPEGDVVQVMDGPTSDPLGNPWYLITDSGVTGWVIGDFLVGANQPPSPNGDDTAAGVASDIAANPLGIATGSFEYPLENFTFTQGFGCSPYWFEPWVASVGCNYHNGVDLAAPAYTSVHAADGGVVEQAGWCDCGLGYYVKIDHGNGFKTIYGHLAEIWVNVGEAVAKDEVIAPVGSTGNSTGPHTHFIVEYQGVTYDPLWYLP